MAVVKTPEGSSAERTRAQAKGPAAAALLPRRLLLTCYLVAGMPLGTFGELIPVVLRTSGASLSDVGLYSLLHLPYGLKVIWGPLVDRLGHPRRWLLACGAGLAIAYATLAGLDPSAGARAFAWATLLLTTASSIYDVAVDASFLRALAGRSPALEARANAWRLSSFKLAMVACSNGCAVLAGYLGFSRVFYGLLGVHLALLALLPWRELTAPVGRPLAWRAYFVGLWTWARGPHVGRAFALVFFYKLAIASLLVLERPYWVDSGVSLTHLGAVGAVAGVTTTVAGAWAGSALAHRYGSLAMLRWGVLAQLGTALCYLGLQRLPCSLGSLAVGLACSGACFGLSTAALMSLITRLCAAPHAATQFAALTGTYALTRSFGGVAAGMWAEHFGYASLFAGVACLTLPALALLPRDPRVRAAWNL